MDEKEGKKISLKRAKFKDWTWKDIKFSHHYISFAIHFSSLPKCLSITNFIKTAKQTYIQKPFTWEDDENITLSHAVDKREEEKEDENVTCVVIELKESEWGEKRGPPLAYHNNKNKWNDSFNMWH